MKIRLCLGVAFFSAGIGLASTANSQSYDLSFSGVVTATNACTFPSTTDCYAPLNSTVSGTLRYVTGSPGLSSPTANFYKNLISDYSITFGGISYTGTYGDPAGFGRFTVSRNAATEAASTSSTFSVYVARNAGNYTFLGGTNTADFAPRVPTSSAVAGDNIYGNLAISEIRVNFGALTGLFANLAVPTTFSFSDLASSVSNFGIGLESDFFLGNNAAYSFGGGLTSVTVRPVNTAAPVPEPETYAMLLAGLGALGCMARRRKRKIAT